MPYYPYRQKGNFLSGCVMVPSHIQVPFTCTLKGKTYKRKASKRQENKRKTRKHEVLKGLNYIGSGEFKANRWLAHSSIFLSKQKLVFLVCPSRPLLACQLDKESVVTTDMEWQAWQTVITYAVFAEQPWTGRGELQLAMRAKGLSSDLPGGSQAAGSTSGYMFLAANFWCQVLLQNSRDHNRERSRMKWGALVLLTQARMAGPQWAEQEDSSTWSSGGLSEVVCREDSAMLKSFKIYGDSH